MPALLRRTPAPRWLLALLLLAAALPLRAQTLGPAQIEQLVAPVALHPDPLLAQILMAATYPGDVAAAADWRAALPPATDARTVAQGAWLQQWEPSVKSLTGFPIVLRMMGERPAWTRALGDAFLAQPRELLDGVQRLRRLALEAGTLRPGGRQAAHVEAGSPPVVRIAPADPGAVFVPTYDPNRAYGRWPYPAYPPEQWYPPGYPSTGMTLAFTAGQAPGDALWGVIDWRGGRILLDTARYDGWNGTLGTDPVWRHDPSRRGAPMPTAIPVPTVGL